MALRTPLYDYHVAAGAKMMEFAGYDMPIRYVGDTEEHRCVREDVGLFDVSHMGEFLLRGPQAQALIQHINSNDVSALPVGKAQYGLLMNPDGGIVDDMIVYHLEPELYLIVVNAANVTKDREHIEAQNAAFGAQFEDLSDRTALFAVSGPKALATVQSITDVDLGPLGYYQVTKGTVAGIDNIMMATTGYTGERTYELFVRTDHAVALWNALLQAGKPHGIQPIGLGARDTLRLEMGFMLYGNDISDTTSPLEAGLGWVTKLAKGPFVGSDKVAALKAAGVTRKLVAFKTEDPRAVPRSHYALAKDGQTIGEVTSGTFSPTLKQGIGLGYVDVAHSAIGSQIEVVIRNKPVPATVVKAPFVSQTSLTGWSK